MNSQLTFNSRPYPKVAKQERPHRYIPNFKLPQPHWKSYIPQDLLPDPSSPRSPKDSRQSVEHSRNRRRDANPPNKDPYDRPEDDEARRRDEIGRRVRELQSKVLPMVEREEEEDVRDIAWQSRVEQKMVHLEGAMDGLRKEMEIEMEKRLLEVEQLWEERFAQLQTRRRHIA